MYSSATQKVTLSLPGELVAFADEQASQQHTSRSQIISQALARFKELTEEELAIEGYLFYAQEAAEFAEAISLSAAEAIQSAEVKPDDR